MSMTVTASHTQVWLESLGEWSWPGRGGAAAEFLPPSWVPTLPPRREPAVLGPGTKALPQPGRARARRLITGSLLGALAVVCVALAHGGQLTLVGSGGAEAVDREAPSISSVSPAQSLPTLEPVSQDAAGSSIVQASYPSAALHGDGSFLVYLPP